MINQETPYPAPAPRSKFPWGILAIGCGVFIVGVAVLSTAVYLSIAGRKPIEVSKNNHPKIVKTDRDGWQAVWLDDFGIGIELPEYPQKVDFKSEKWPWYVRVGLQQYGGYDFVDRNEEEHGRLYGYAYRRPYPDFKQTTLDRLRREEAEETGSELVDTQTVPRIVSGFSGTQVTYTLKYGGDSFVRRCFIMIGQRSYRSIDLTWWSDDPDGPKNFERMMKSLKILPNDPKLTEWP